MSNNNNHKIVAIILIVIASFFAVGVLVIWAVPAMMGGMMGSRMMGAMAACRICAAGPFLLAALFVVVAIVLLRSGERR